MKYTTFFAILVLLLLLSATPALPQEEEPGWDGDIGIGLALQRGNTDTTSATFSFKAHRMFRDKFTWQNSAFYLLNESKSVKTGESMGFTTHLDIMHTERFFSFGEIQGLRNYFKDYDYRISPGVGVGYIVVGGEKVTFDIFSGVSQVFTKYKTSGETDDYTAVKIGDRLTWKISSNSELSQLLEYATDVSNSEVYTILFKLGVTAALTGSWALKVEFTDNYDSNPPVPTLKKNDIALVAGITRKF